MSQATLKAEYASPTASHVLEQSISTASAGSEGQGPAAQSEYIKNLRKAVKQLQSEVNNLLTAQMEAEKTRLGELKSEKERELERRAEETYGEEIVD
jgi:hypothetical protein